MQSWNDILHTALLGTDKQTPASEYGGADKEEAFLNQASVAFNYRQAGMSTPSKEGVTLPMASAEELPYCSPKAMDVLSEIISERNSSLMGIWLNRCAERGRIVRPEVLPVLLGQAAQDAGSSSDIMCCIGKRGEWLIRLNPLWAKVVLESEEERWQTGSLEQRRQVIRSLRVSDPSRARAWIQQVWSQEDANTRLELLKLLAINISADDISFLEEVSKEKAKKVKEEGRDLLSRIPESGLVRTAASMVLNLLVYRSGRLGVCAADAEDQKLLDSLGIEKLSNRKELSDDEFIVWQLLKIVPLPDLESAWGLDTAGLVRLFDGDVIGQKLFSGLVVAISRFGDRVRALEMMRNAKTTYLDLFSLLPAVEQNEYAIKVFNEAADEITRYLATVEWEWSATLTQLIMNHANKNPYQYPKHSFHD